MIDGIPVLLVGWCLVSGALINAFAVVFIIAWVLFKLLFDSQPRCLVQGGWQPKAGNGDPFTMPPTPKTGSGVKPPNEGTSGVLVRCARVRGLCPTPYVCRFHVGCAP